MLRPTEVITFYLFVTACFDAGYSSTIPQDPVLYTVSNGRPCLFPFIYENRAHFTPLVGDGTGLLWCGSVPNLDFIDVWDYIASPTCRFEDHGYEYTGDISHTVNGETCQRWDSQFPHSHIYTIPELYPDTSFENIANNCRNPLKSKAEPYCKTTNPDIPFEFCDIPYCDQCTGRIMAINSTHEVDDSAITASSENATLVTYNSASAARLDFVQYVGVNGTEVAAGWCADNTDPEPWIQVSLDQTYRFIGVIAQGGLLEGGDPWSNPGVEEFKVQYSVDNLAWTTVQNSTNGDELFLSYGHAQTPSPHKFNESFFAQYVRIVVTGWYIDPCMRFDFEACPDTDDCLTHTCANGAECVDMTNSYHCICPTGWTGQLCDTWVDNCISDPCENGGSCVNAFMNYTCSCFAGYYGKHCEIGGLPSCADVALAGATESGFYGIDLGNTGPCEMRPGLLGAWDYQNTDGYWSQADMNLTECEQLCLDDSKCLSINYFTDRECFLRDFYSEGLLMGPQAGQTYSKYCPEVKKIYCLMTNLSTPIMVINHHFDVNYTASRGPDDYTYRTHLADYMPLSATDLELIKNNSHSCSQSLDYYCFGSAGSNTELFFTGRVPEAMGNYLYPGDDCDCLLRGICTDDGGYRCNCTYYWGSVPNHDWDTYTDKTLLPILGLRAGGLGGSYKRIKFDLGPMLCMQPTFEVNECESDPCRNGGTCVDDRYRYSCLCASGWGGPDCTTDVNECLSNPCQNGGMCLEFLGYFQCQCVPGYNGSMCEIDVNECDSNPCLNGASCIDMADRWRCSCDPGFTGLNCGIEIMECNSSPCLNGGVCVEDIAGYNCSCVAGYGGQDCMDDLNECESSPCVHGECKDYLDYYECVCHPGYEGMDCDQETDECLSDPCEYGGTCSDDIAGFTCTCADGFAGPHCQIDMDECSSNPCKNGDCQDGTNGYACDCRSGYTGESCEETVDECLSDPCANGRCVDSEDGFACECDPGYTDESCSTDINECASFPCLFGGTCFNNISRFDCACPPGTAGARCELNTIDGQWGGWGTWSDCTAQCGNGVRTRMRECNNPPAQNGGMPCPGDQSQVQMCVQLSCDNVNGQWGEWSEFGRCSVTCGPGMMLRTRLCDSPAQQGTGLPCSGSPNSTAPCQEWECGQPLDGRWGTWGPWSSCSASCGVGTKSRRRACDDPPAVYGGEPCPGVGYGTAPCMPLICTTYEDCEEWGEWSECSQTCGSGTHTRQRICRLPEDIRKTIEAARLRASRGMPNPEDELLPLWYWNVSLSQVTHALGSCQDQPCDEHKCITCSSEYAGTASSLTCKGPRLQCSADYPYCVHTFDPLAVIPSMSKGCAAVGDCVNVSTECENLKLQTLSEIMSTTPPRESDLAPHPDTLLQSWNALMESCTICCKDSLCNRYNLPPGATLYNNANVIASVNIYLATAVAFIFTAQYLLWHMP